VLLAIAFPLAMPVFAQIDTGIISGKVTDPSGAVIPGARLTITQTATNFESISQTDSDGVYRVPSLQPGLYRVSVTAPGFKTYTQDGIILRIGDDLGVNMKLEVGATSDSIEVKYTPPLLETQTSSTGQVMEGDHFYELPNLQHWEKGVMFYTPQVQTTNAPWPGSLGNWSINGGNSYQIGYFEDGQLATTMNGGTTMNSISVGDEEVKVLSTVLPAEYGHATTGAISVVKKGGTNQLHGTGGELYAPTSFNQRRFFALQTPQQQGINDLFQQPDFAVGGPVYIPKVYNGKNKTFFEVAGSYHIDHQSNASSYSTPTADELAGNFNFPGVAANTIYDPASTSGTFAAGNLSRTPFPNNTIPQNRFSTMWNNIVSHNPFAPPNNSGTQNPTGPTGNIIGDGVEHYYNKATQVRIDHQFTPNFKIFASYIKDDNYQPEVNPVIVYQNFDADQVYTPTLQDVASLGFTYTISPTLISETRAGQYRQTNNPVSPTGNFQFAAAGTVPNLPANVYLNPVNLGLASEGTYGNGFIGAGTLNTAVNTIYQFRQDFTKVKGTHSFKFGYEYVFEGYNSHTISNPRLTLGFGGTNGINNLGTTLPNTEITLADVMLGYVYSYSYAQQGQSLLPEDSIHSLYVQDDWRILPNLTLNLGVRYSNESPIHGKYPGGLSEGSLTAPDDYYPQSIPGTVTCPSTGCVGAWIQPKGGLYNRDNDNFQPRIGFAWNVGHNTVIRGGYAIMTLDLNLWYTGQNEAAGGSYLSTGTVTQPANVYTPLFNINQGVPTPVYPAVQANGTIPTAGLPQNRGTLTVIPANFHNPYTQNWNFVIQHAIKTNYVVSLTYSGSHNTGFQGSYNWDSRPFGTGLDANGNVINLAAPALAAYRNTWISNTTATQAYKPYPSWNAVTYDCNCISSVYDSGTVSVEKRSSNGLTLLAFFTYQKGLQNAAGFGQENLYVPSNVGRGVTNITQKFRFTSSMTYDLPFGRGKHFMNQGRLKNLLLGGYSLSWNFSVWSPTPSGISYSGFSVVNPATGVLGPQQEYPSYEPGTFGAAYLLQDPALRSDWQDIGTNRFVQSGQNSLIGNCGTLVSNVGNNCIVAAPSFTNGNIPANEWISQRIIAANMSAYKNIPIKERVQAQIRFDFFNPLKWFNWGPPSTALANANPAIFGTPGLNGESSASTEGGPPIMNLSFRVRF
jgi:hypothetical protein